MDRMNVARDIFIAVPGTCTKKRQDEVLAPKTAFTPVQPSLPIVAISTMLPSEYWAAAETTPLFGKKMWSIELSASRSICSRWQHTCSSCGMRLLRSRAGSASRRRLRGQADRAFILTKCRSVSSCSRGGLYALTGGIHPVLYTQVAANAQAAYGQRRKSSAAQQRGSFPGVQQIYRMRRCP